MAEKIVKDSQGLAKKLVNDCISRQAMLDLIEDDSSNGVYSCFASYEDAQKFKQKVMYLPHAQPESAERTAKTEQNVSDGDLISRKAAIEALHMHLMYRLGTDSNKKRLDEWVNNLPSAQPERRMPGKWIYGEDEYGIDGYHCDECGFFVPWDYAHKFINYIEDYNFCPNCGADMREGRKK